MSRATNTPKKSARAFLFIKETLAATTEEERNGGPGPNLCATHTHTHSVATSATDACHAPTAQALPQKGHTQGYSHARKASHAQPCIIPPSLRLGATPFILIVKLR
jgi:hypothetical protein